MGVWSKWLNSTLEQSPSRRSPSVQEQRILRLAAWIDGATTDAPAVKEIGAKAAGTKEPGARSASAASETAPAADGR